MPPRMSDMMLSGATEDRMVRDPSRIRVFRAEPGSRGRSGGFVSVASRSSADDEMTSVMDGLLDRPLDLRGATSGFGRALIQQMASANDMEREALMAGGVTETLLAGRVAAADNYQRRDPDMPTDQRFDKVPIQDATDSEERYGPEGIGRESASDFKPGDRVQVTGGDQYGASGIVESVDEQIGEANIRTDSGGFVAVDLVNLTKAGSRIGERVSDPRTSSRLGTVVSSLEDGTHRVQWDDGGYSDVRLSARDDMPSEGRTWDVRRHGEAPPIPVSQQDLTDLDEGFSLGRKLTDDEKFQRREGSRVNKGDDLLNGLDVRVANVRCPSCRTVEEHIVSEAALECGNCNFIWSDPDGRTMVSRRAASDSDEGNQDPKWQNMQGNPPRERTNYGEHKGADQERLIEASSTPLKIGQIGGVELWQVGQNQVEHRDVRSGSRVITNTASASCSCGGVATATCQHLRAIGF